MAYLDTFLAMLDNQRDDSALRFHNCANYSVSHQDRTTVLLPDDDVEFVFDAQGRFLGVDNIRVKNVLL